MEASTEMERPETCRKVVGRVAHLKIDRLQERRKDQFSVLTKLNEVNNVENRGESTGKDLTILLSRSSHGSRS